MLKLPAKDAYVLGRIAQYKDLPKNERIEILKEATTSQARKIGSIIIHGRSRKASKQVREAARHIQEWAASNRVFLPVDLERKRSAR
jgi:hypothetical protein